MSENRHPMLWTDAPAYEMARAIAHAEPDAQVVMYPGRHGVVIEHVTFATPVGDPVSAQTVLRTPDPARTCETAAVLALMLCRGPFGPDGHLSRRKGRKSGRGGNNR